MLAQLVVSSRRRRLATAVPLWVLSVVLVIVGALIGGAVRCSPRELDAGS